MPHCNNMLILNSGLMIVVNEFDSMYCTHQQDAINVPLESCYNMGFIVATLNDYSSHHTGNFFACPCMHIMLAILRSLVTIKHKRTTCSVLNISNCNLSQIAWYFSKYKLNVTTRFVLKSMQSHTYIQLYYMCTELHMQTIAVPQQYNYYIYVFN